MGFFFKTEQEKEQKRLIEEKKVLYHNLTMVEERLTNIHPLDDPAELLRHIEVVKEVINSIDKKIEANK